MIVLKAAIAWQEHNDCCEEKDQGILIGWREKGVTVRKQDFLAREMLGPLHFCYHCLILQATNELATSVRYHREHILP